ncbi:MAG TPA: hypothetical protein VGR95_01720 [Thermoanaerobaculia bacterium]|jgi:hypothetical protein|nr:hypothetical protein [Thermoanaerobaculia bacterium]
MSTAPAPPVHVDPLKKYDTVVSSGQSALRALLTINAGATITVLTMVGHLWDSHALTRGSSEVFVAALQYYIWATFLALLAYGTIFFTNCLSSQEREGNDGHSAAWRRSANFMFGVTVVAGVMSAALFLVASRQAVEAFRFMSRLLH